MKKKISLILLLVMLISLLSACADRSGTTLMTLTEDGKTYTITANTYQLILSRAKASLILSGSKANGYSPTVDGYWNYTDLFDDYGKMSMNDYYRKVLLESCEYYLVGQYWFDYYGLSLSESDEAEIEEMMNEYLLTDGNGSKTALNQTLSAYGVNYDLLEDTLTIEQKMSVLKDYLYNNSGDNLKNQFLEENYIHFYQIFLPNYKYVYETDANGDVIYYNEDGTTIAYDTVNGVTQKKDGSKVTDDNGDIVYYEQGTDYKKIAYDEENGTPAYTFGEDGSTAQTEAMTDEELTDQENLAKKLYNDLTDATESDFMAQVNEYSADMLSTYTDGYYIEKNTISSYTYMNEIIAWGQTAQVGDTTLIASDYGWFIVRMFEPTEGAYDLEENTQWFSDFTEDFADAMLEEDSAPYLEKIIIDQEALDEVPDMADIEPSYYY